MPNNRFFRRTLSTVRSPILSVFSVITTSDSSRSRHWKDLFFIITEMSSSQRWHSSWAKQNVHIKVKVHKPYVLYNKSVSFADINKVIFCNTFEQCGICFRIYYAARCNCKWPLWISPSYSPTALNYTAYECSGGCRIFQNKKESQQYYWRTQTQTIKWNGRN